MLARERAAAAVTFILDVDEVLKRVYRERLKMRCLNV